MVEDLSIDFGKDNLAFEKGNPRSKGLLYLTFYIKSVFKTKHSSESLFSKYILNNE